MSRLSHSVPPERSNSGKDDAGATSPATPLGTARAGRHRSRRPKQISAQQETSIVEPTMKTTPKDATHWSVRTMVAAQNVSAATVQRIWKKHRLQPNRTESFKFSNDPQFARKVRDIVGLYLNPPDKAIVLSVDEKSQIVRRDKPAWNRG